MRCRSPTTPGRPEPSWFGLFPVRSPLLGESRLFSSPPGTKMFQFPGFASLLSKDDRPSACRVAPFRNPRIKGRLHLPEAYRSLPRLSSPTRAKASAMCPFLLSPNRNISKSANQYGYTSRHIPSAFYVIINRLSFLLIFFNLFLEKSVAFSFPVPICQRPIANT